MPTPKVPPEFDQMSTAEKIEYVQKLWERIADEPDSIELTDEQRAELDSRLEAHRQRPQDVSPWQQVKKRIRGEE